ncbi:hypothetical protein GALMADRAFT_246786 [Galerina marginata CBS 339.88]|uniref:Uncharacterized protein n=1 Tax=Galerina marginata (strain CBS 339.88) TaxID=685588 RepID=A0A067SZV1_GALM3|nr:hypothetical protein GALMADRAFT_246786 [Galerina marginata CBS 339.88]
MASVLRIEKSRTINEFRSNSIIGHPDVNEWSWVSSFLFSDFQLPRPPCDMHRDSNSVRAQTLSVTETRSFENPSSQARQGERSSGAAHMVLDPVENEPFRSHSESDVSTAPSQTQAMAIPSTSISPTPMTTQRPRVRRIPTKEVGPQDSQSLIDLGMSPFMPVQDAMFNQNRLVRNEAILAKHVSRLQHSYSLSESNHAQRVQDIYRSLTDHKAAIDSQAATSITHTSIRSDPDFTALFDAHVETRIALNHLIRKFSSSSASIKSSIDQLNESIRRITSGTSIEAMQYSGQGSATDSVKPKGTTALPIHSAKIPLPEAANSSSTHGIKRKRVYSNPNLSPSSSIATSHTGSPIEAAHHLHLSRSDYTFSTDTSKDVIYGPVDNTDDHLNAKAIVNEAIHSVGLSPSMVQSILTAPGHPEFLNVRFLKHDYASRFVDLVGFGLEGQPSRKAFFADGSSDLIRPDFGVASDFNAKIR